VSSVLGRRDVAATILVTALVVVYLSFLASGTVFLIAGTRDMAAVALMLGGAVIALLLADGTSDAVTWLTLTTAVVAVTSGALALAFSPGTEADVLLAVYVGAVLVVWAVELAEHIVIPPSSGGPR
jgi:hypothetical protein